MRFALLTTVVAFWGCGGGPTGSVEGTVTLDDNPLEYGSISFKSESGDTSTAGGVIENGSFTIEEVPVGNFIVVVTAGSKNAGGNGQPSSGDGSTTGDDAMERYKTVRNADGNNKKVEVTEGENSIKIELVTNQD